MDDNAIRFEKDANEDGPTRNIDPQAFRKEDTVEMTPLEHKIAGNELLNEDYLNGHIKPSDADATVVKTDVQEYGKHEPTEKEKDAVVDFEVRKRLYGVPVVKNGDKFESNGYKHEDGLTPLDEPMQLGKKGPEPTEPEPRQIPEPRPMRRKKQKDPLDDFFK